MASLDKVLNSLEDGNLKGIAGDRLDELVRAVQDTRKAGKISIEIEAKPIGDTDTSL